MKWMSKARDPSVDLYYICMCIIIKCTIAYNVDPSMKRKKNNNLFLALKSMGFSIPGRKCTKSIFNIDHLSASTMIHLKLALSFRPTVW